MNADLISAIAGVATLVLGVIGWVLSSAMKTIRDQIAVVAEGVLRIETDVRQLSATTGEHGKALAAGNSRFSALDAQVERLEARLRDLERDCAACQRSQSAPDLHSRMAGLEDLIRSARKGDG